MWFNHWGRSKGVSGGDLGRIEKQMLSLAVCMYWGPPKKLMYAHDASASGQWRTRLEKIPGKMEKHPFYEISITGSLKYVVRLS